MSRSASATPAPETFIVTSRKVWCDGSDSALGHPRVYLDMGAKTEVECPYCDRRFVLDPGAEGHESH